jgi:tetratricopeptide (TPR) repeat protein
MRPCPPPDDLVDLLAEPPDGRGAPSEALRAHVAACPRCQALLDTMTDAPDLSRWASSARTPPPGTDPADEPELREVVGRLLTEEPTLADAPSPMPFLGPPRREGDLGTLDGYSVRAELGRGGMGIVLLAVDEALRRPVALKVLRPELADERSRARFVREARAAAGVRHDHVVGVYAVADPPGALPYCVLEYLAGASLADRIRAEGRLEPRAAAVVAAQVAEGLAAAHAAGLVHRDVKPANILFDPATGRAKVADFGLARAVAADSDLTRPGLAVGTPSYMSPEQARGADAVGPASDLFSLGATLYEALTGALPFPGAPHMVLQQVQHDEPRPPRALNDAIPRDLETICLKCLQKEPARRYAGAAELAADLRRLLAGEPIAARPVTRRERALRWARRRPALTALGAFSLAATLALIAGGVAYTLQLRAANRRAEANFQTAFEAVDRMLTRVADRALADVPGMEPVRRDLLADALGFLQDFVARPGRSSDPAVRRELGLAYHRMANIHGVLGRPDLAEPEFRRAIAIQQRLVAESPARANYRRELSGTREEFGRALSDRYRRREAESELEAARALLEPLARDDPGVQARVAHCCDALALLYQATGRTDAAEQLHLRAVGLLEPRLRDGGPTAADSLAHALYNLAIHYQLSGRPDRAELHFRRCLGLWDTSVRDRRGSHTRLARLAACCHGLGQVCMDLGRAREAEPLLARSLAIREQLARQLPDSPEVQADLARAHHGLAVLYASQRRTDEAEAAYRRARAIHADLVAAYPQKPRYRQLLAETVQNLAMVYQSSGRPALAESSFAEALAATRAVLAEFPRDAEVACLMVTTLKNLAIHLTATGRVPEALARLDQAVGLGERIHREQPGSPASRQALLNAHGARAQAREARGLFVEAADDWGRVGELDAPANRDRWLTQRCSALLRAGDYRGATTAAARLVDRPGAPGDALYNAACVASLASAAARADAGLAPSAREEFGRLQAATALRLLHRARARGFFADPANVAHLGVDTDLDPLRPLPEFRALSLELTFPADPFARAD